MTAELLKEHLVNATQPWIEISRVWRWRGETASRLAVEGLTGALDTGRYLARVGLGLVYGMGSMLNAQMLERIDDLA